MTKQEFLQELQRALVGKLDSAKVQELAAYYSEYFEIEVRKGAKEEDVAASLGSPRLLAKSILEAAGNEREKGNGSDGRKAYASGRGSRLKKWFAGFDQRKLKTFLIIISVVIVLIVAVGLITSLIWAFLPVLLPLAIVLLAVRWYQRQ